MPKKIDRKFRLSDRDYDDLQRALEVFTATTSEILEDWFPKLQGRDWTISEAGVVTIYKEN
jgi:hypothetical protein